MSKVTIITGAPASGKTRKAVELSKDRKSIWLQSLEFQHIRTIPQDTEVIVLDGNVSRYELERIKSICTSDTLTIRRHFQQETIQMKTPEIIATTNLEFPEEEVRRFNVIRL